MGEPSAAATAVRRQAKRPVAVTFVGALGLGAGLYHLVGGGMAVADGGSASKLAEGAFDLALAVLALAIGRGALRMAPWAWTALMTWAVIGLTHQLLRHFFYSDESYGMLAVEVAVVLALTPLEIQVAFGVRRRPTLDSDSGALDVGG
jgi:hypothetical protein